MTTPEEVHDILNGPALQPPPGVHPNFINPENLHVAIVVTFVLCVFISTLVFWMRLYTKLYIIHRTGWDDYLAFLAWLMYLACFVPCNLVVHTVEGVHQWNVQVKTMIKALFYINVASIIHGITVALIQVSLLLQYLQIFAPVRKNSLMVRLTYLVIWSTSIFHLITAFITIFPCNPREKFWNVLITDGRCLNMDVVNIAASIINSVCDFIILLLPQGVIWKLQMPIRRKLGISAIFLIGLLACIASIMRLYYSIRVLQTGDDTYYLVIFGLWTHAEFTLAIICGSLPVSPRFFQTFQPKILRLSRSCFQMRAIPQKIIFGLFTVNRGKESSSTCRGNGPYELHGEYSTTEVYGLNSTKESGTVVSAGGKTPRSLASSAGGPVAGLDSGEGRPDKNQILKTVNIETIEEAPNGSDTDVERQHSQSGW